MSKLELGPRPDEFGFLYGHCLIEGRPVSVDILPPVGEWQGGQVLEGYEPDPVAWIVYLEGEEVARVTRREELPELPSVLARLPAARDGGRGAD